METLLLDLLQLPAVPRETLVIYREEGNLSDHFRATGARMTRMTPREGFDIRYLFRLRRLLRRERVDILHAQHPLEAARAWLACLFTGVKIVQTFHGYDFHQSRVGALVTRWMIRRASLNIFVSETQRRYYMQRYRLALTPRQAVVYNGVRFDKIPTVARREGCPDVWSLGMVGNFVAGRDQQTVCRFLKLLKEAGVPFRFLFAGNHETPRGEACARYIREHGLSAEVTLAGPRDDVPAILAGLDAFIYASDHDTFGIAVIEAIAAAIPVFVNDWEVMREITADGTLATLYRTRDEHDLLRLFLDFTARPPAYRHAAARSATLVRSRYDIHHHLSRLHEQYHRLLP
jgi:glycosyltransferase involved in cell wall biosynthesis